MKCYFIGHVGQNANVSTYEGKTVINFSVAVNEKYKDKEVTTWVSCALWRESKIHEFLVKGTQVFVEGSVSVRSYVDSKNEKQYQLSVLVDEIKLLNSKSNNNEQQQQSAAENLSF